MLFSNKRITREKQPNQSTDFAFSRFIPYLSNYKGLFYGLRHVIQR